VNLLLRIIVAATPKDGVQDEVSHDHRYGITDPLTKVAVVLSALIHDVNHKGISNEALQLEEAELANKYANKQKYC
jgi:3'5'-cyclic nucleotide phosphodiesterase